MEKSRKFNSKRSTKRLYKKKKYKTNKRKYNTKKRYNTKKIKKSIYQKSENVINKRRKRRRRAIRKMMVGGMITDSNMQNRVMTHLTLEPFFTDLLVPATLILGKELKSDSKKYICECVFDGKECIFKYDDTPLDGSMRFRVDMRLSDKGINVSDANVKTAFGKPAIINLCVGLESYNQLHKTIEQIKSMADVLDIARVGLS